MHQVDAPATTHHRPADAGTVPPPHPLADQAGPGVVGAAGGVGTSTLARDLDYDDLEQWLPPASSRTLVVAAAGTADGMAAAMAMVERLRRHPGHVVLAVVDDGGGPVPPIVKARKRLLKGHVAAVVDVPYVPLWRYSGTGETPTMLYRDVIRRLGQLAAPVDYLARSTP